MGFFSDLKKLSLGGQIGGALTGRKNEGSFGMAVLKGPKKPKPPEPFNPNNRVGATIGGESGVDQPALRLGWTNGGYTYNNSPFNAGMAKPSAMPTGGPAMGFGGPQQQLPGPQQMPVGMAGPQPMPIKGGVMPMSGPKMDPRIAQQQMVAQMLRARGGGAY